MSRQTKSSLTSSGRVGSRFSRSTTPYELPLERPPVVLEWGSAVLRIGYAEKFQPQFVQPYENRDYALSEFQWYAELAPVVSKLWDTLFLSPNSTRRVVCVHPAMMPRAWRIAMTKALESLGVPGVCFVNGLDTIPYGIGFKRGLILNFGRQEAHVVAHVDGRALEETLQVVPCGYEVVLDQDKDAAEVKWGGKMDWHLLDESNPHSLVFAMLKSIQATPIDVRSDVVANIVLVSETLLVIPDLDQRIGKRLVSLLKPETNAQLPIPDDTAPEELTTTPTQWKTLSSLASKVCVISTKPIRPDGLTWMSAAVWASVWYRHEGTIKWITF